MVMVMVNFFDCIILVMLHFWFLLAMIIWALFSMNFSDVLFRH